jgi:hypothetical protein
MRFSQFLPLFVLLFATTTPAFAQHRILAQAPGKLLVIEKDGSVSWEMPWTSTHDLHRVDDDHIMAIRGPGEVCIINMKDKKVTWSYRAGKMNGNEGKRVEVHAVQPLDGGNVMIAESGPARMIEVDKDGKIVKKIDFVIDKPNAHSDTRLARKTAADTYLVAHENDGKVREYDEQGSIIWEYEVPMFDKEPKGGHGPEAFGNQLFTAVRLKNGNTLIGGGNGHCILEVNHDKEIVWEVHQKDLPGIVLAWVTTVDVLDNGHYLIGNCHAGEGQPVLIELDPKTKKVVWQLDAYKTVGNDCSNTLVLE